MSKIVAPQPKSVKEEKIINMFKATETLLEIDLNALMNNIRFLQSKIRPGTKFLAVVKAYAYGSDAVVIAKTLQKSVDYFAVAYTNEGEVLRKNGIRKSIIVLHSLPVNFDMIIENHLEPSVYSLKMMKSFIAYVEEKKMKDYPIHLKFNTGLNRLGFEPEEVSEIIEILSKTNSVKVASVFSHLAASEDRNEKDFTLQQIQDFKTISDEVINQLGYIPLRHCTNTSGILNYPEAHFDMVRCGIGLYGFGNAKEVNKYLEPVGTLKTVISQIHAIKKDESVGYNRAFIAPKNMRSATLPLGHADGIPRSYGNGKGWAVINGKKAPFIGNVCMDMLMVDVTDIDCDEGDEVIIFGKINTAEELSASIHSIPYELITAISQRIKRVVIEQKNEEK